MRSGDFLGELGLNALVTRLKRVSDAMLHDGKRMYKELGMDIEPNWFAVFKLLDKYGPMSVTEIADRIGFSHPSVISIVNKMIKAGYLGEARNDDDSRLRILSLTPKAASKMPEFEKVWNSGMAAYKKMLPDVDVMHMLDVLETRVAERGFRERALEQLEKYRAVEIVDYDRRYDPDFARLNYEWIERAFSIEEHDREQLDHPHEHIILPGGHIFFARVNGEMVGTAALIEMNGDEFELAKMSVSPDLRGYGIGDRLLEASIEYSKKAGKKRIILETNSKQFQAIKMYHKWGFYDIPLDPNSQFARADVRMQMDLVKS